jgi:hypothetical protein
MPHPTAVGQDKQNCDEKPNENACRRVISPTSAGSEGDKCHARHPTHQPDACLMKEGHRIVARHKEPSKPTQEPARPDPKGHDEDCEASHTRSVALRADSLCD